MQEFTKHPKRINIILDLDNTLIVTSFYFENLF